MSYYLCSNTHCLQVRVTNILLEHGSQVDPVDIFGQIPLHWAAKRGDVETCQLLLKHKADVNKKDRWNKIPLHYAKTVEITKVLLEHGSQVDPVDDYMRTPLHEASQRGDLGWNAPEVSGRNGIITHYIIQLQNDSEIYAYNLTTSNIADNEIKCGETAVQTEYSWVI